MKSFADVLKWDDGPSTTIPCCDCGTDVEVCAGLMELAQQLNRVITTSRKLNGCKIVTRRACDDECFRRQAKRYLDPFSADRRCLGPPLNRNELVRCPACLVVFNDLHNRRINKVETKVKPPVPKQKSLLDEIGDDK